MTAICTRDGELEEFVGHAAGVEVLALDTEFLRERTYYPELCLIQAASAEQLVLIDPLAELDLAPLEPVLAQGPVKVLHACRQDQEVLATRFGRPLAPIFDTQLAAALCGYPPQWSYAKLVQEFAGVELGKGATRTDWSRRPLSAAQLDYAADDVRYLLGAHAALAERLEALGRRSWFDEEMASLAAQPWDVAPDEAWRRVKGHGSLSGEALAALQALAAWRERRAVERNKPRRWIAKDESLLVLAQARPADAAALRALGGVEPFLQQRQGEELLRALEEARGATPPELDLRIPDKAVVARLRQTLNALAAELELDPGVLATRADLNALALDGLSERLSAGWRAEIVAPVLGAKL